MSIHAAGCPRNWPYLEAGNRMIGHFQIGFKIAVADLLEEYGQFSLDFLSEMEEVELITFPLGKNAVDQLLELLRTSLDGQLEDPQ